MTIMEPASLTIGIVALAGLFNSALECFDYIQLGKCFERNFETCLLRLDNAKLRLSRWGQSVHINDTSVAPALVDAETISAAERTLQHILLLFEDAEKTSMRFRDSNSARNDPSTLVVHDWSDALDGRASSLHRAMNDLSLSRRKKTGLRQRVKWALYEEKTLRRLIEDICGHVTDLETLFPSTGQARQQLCQSEISTIGKDKDSLVRLEEITRDQDEELCKAITAALSQTTQYQPAVVFSGHNNSGIQIGNNSGAFSNISSPGAKPASCGED